MNTRFLLFLLTTGILVAFSQAQPTGSVTVDCMGVPFGTTKVDICGVCGGNNQSCCLNYLGVENRLWDWILLQAAIDESIVQLKSVQAKVDCVNQEIPKINETCGFNSSLVIERLSSLNVSSYLLPSQIWQQDCLKRFNDKIEKWTCELDPSTCCRVLKVNSEVKVDLLVFSDPDAQLEPIEIPTIGSVGGYAYISTYFNNYRTLNPNTLTIIGGDAYGTTQPLASNTTITALAYNDLKVDVALLSDSDFERGIEDLQKNLEITRHTTVGVNVWNTTGVFKGVSPWTMKSIGGVSIAFIGVVTPEVFGGIREGNWSGSKYGLSAGDPFLYTKAAISEAKKSGANAIVVLTHMGITGYDQYGRPKGPLADFTLSLDGLGVNVIFGEETDFEYFGLIGNTWVIENRGRGRTFSKVSLTIAGGKLTGLTNQFITPITSGITPDINLVRLLSPIIASRDNIYNNQKIGSVTTPFIRGNENYNETALGNLVVDAIRWKYNTQLAIINSGAILDNLPSSYTPRQSPLDIVNGDAWKILYFGDRVPTTAVTDDFVITRTITGKLLFNLMEESIFNRNGSSGFLQISGFRVKYNETKPIGSRIVVITLDLGNGNGKQIYPNEEIFTLALPRFLNNGGDGYSLLNTGEGYPRASLPVVFRDYISSLKSPISPYIEGRILKYKLFQLQLLHLSSFHGQIEPIVTPVEGSYPATSIVGGAAYIQTYWTALKSLPEVFTIPLVAGDLWGAPTNLSRYYKDELTVEALNGLGIMAATAASHEYDSGLSKLKSNIDLAKFPFLSANLRVVQPNLANCENYNQSIPDYIRPYLIVNYPFEGIRVGIIGITEQTAKTQTGDKNFGTLAIADPITSARQAVDEVRRLGANVIVGLVHLGFNNITPPYNGSIVDFAQQVDCFDAILGAHTDLNLTIMINRTAVVVPRERGREFSVVRIDVKDFQVQPPRASIVVPLITNLTTQRNDTYYNNVLSESIRLYRANVLDRKIGVLQDIYTYNPTDMATKLTNLGVFVADVIKNHFKQQIAFIPAIEIRAPLISDYCPLDRGLAQQIFNTLRRFVPAGPGGLTGPPYDVVDGDIATSFPINSEIILLNLTGAELWKAMEVSLSQLPSASDKFLQLSGIDVRYNVTAPSGSRVTKISLIEDGTPILKSSTEIFTVAMPSYISDGRLGYDFFGVKGQGNHTALTIADVISYFIAKENRKPSSIVCNQSPNKFASESGFLFNGAYNVYKGLTSTGTQADSSVSAYFARATPNCASLDCWDILAVESFVCSGPGVSSTTRTYKITDGVNIPGCRCSSATIGTSNCYYNCYDRAGLRISSLPTSNGTDSKFVVAWTESLDRINYNISAKLFSNGAAVGIIPSQIPVSGKEAISISSLQGQNNGLFVLAWVYQGNVNFQVYNNAFSPIGNLVTIPNLNATLVSVAGLGEGSIGLAYQTNTSQTFGIYYKFDNNVATSFRTFDIVSTPNSVAVYGPTAVATIDQFWVSLSSVAANFAPLQYCSSMVYRYDLNATFKGSTSLLEQLRECDPEQQNPNNFITLPDQTVLTTWNYVPIRSSPNFLYYSFDQTLSEPSNRWPLQAVNISDYPQGVSFIPAVHGYGLQLTGNNYLRGSIDRTFNVTFLGWVFRSTAKPSTPTDPITTIIANWPIESNNDTLQDLNAKGQFHLYISDTNMLSMDFIAGNPNTHKKQTVSDSTPFSVGVWEQIGFTISPYAVTLYRNGKQVGINTLQALTGTGNLVFLPNINYTSIGAWAFLNRTTGSVDFLNSLFTGYIDDFAFWSSVWDDQAIWNQYLAERRQPKMLAMRIDSYGTTTPSFPIRTPGVYGDDTINGRPTVSALPHGAVAYWWHAEGFNVNPTAYAKFSQVISASLVSKFVYINNSWTTSGGPLQFSPVAPIDYSGSLSGMAWVKKTVSGILEIFTQYQGSNKVIRLLLEDNSPGVIIRVITGGTFRGTTNKYEDTPLSSLPINTWYHVAFTFNNNAGVTYDHSYTDYSPASRLRLYFNGLKVYETFDQFSTLYSAGTPTQFLLGDPNLSPLTTQNWATAAVTFNGDSRTGFTDAEVTLNPPVTQVTRLTFTSAVVQHQNATASTGVNYNISIFDGANWIIVKEGWTNTSVTLSNAPINLPGRYTVQKIRISSSPYEGAGTQNWVLGGDIQIRSVQPSALGFASNFQLWNGELSPGEIQSQVLNSPSDTVLPTILVGANSSGAAYAFFPSTLTINLGTTVLFEARIADLTASATSFTVLSDVQFGNCTNSNLWKSPTLTWTPATIPKWSYTFNQRGVYPFFEQNACATNRMFGQITVN